MGPLMYNNLLAIAIHAFIPYDLQVLARENNLKFPAVQFLSKKGLG